MDAVREAFLGSFATEVANRCVSHNSCRSRHFTPADWAGEVRLTELDILATALRQWRYTVGMLRKLGVLVSTQAIFTTLCGH